MDSELEEYFRVCEVVKYKTSSVCLFLLKVVSESANLISESTEALFRTQSKISDILM